MPSRASELPNADADSGEPGLWRHGLDACPNCNHELRAWPSARHCPKCGQETQLEAPSFRAFVREFVDHYVAAEGSLWRTLSLLIFAPGVLTLEYLRGRRGRYVLPLRLFLTTSFLFFLLFKIVNPVDLRLDAASLQSSQAEISTQLARCRQEPGACSKADTRVLSWVSQLANNPQWLPQVGAKLLAVAPYAVFAMIPWFAGLMQWAYRRRHRPYGEHFVFALHAHALWFLAMIFGHMLPDLVGLWLLLPLFVHGVWAMHRVYHGRWAGAVARALLVTVVYGLSMSLMASLVVAIAVGAT